MASKWALVVTLVVGWVVCAYAQDDDASCELVVETSNVPLNVFPSTSPVFSVYATLNTDSCSDEFDLEYEWTCVKTGSTGQCVLGDLEFPLKGVTNFLLPASIMEVETLHHFELRVTASNGTEDITRVKAWNVVVRWRDLVNDIAYQTTTTTNTALTLDGRLSFDPEGALVEDQDSYSFKWDVCLWDTERTQCATRQPDADPTEGIVTTSPVLSLTNFLGTDSERWRFRLTYAHAPTSRQQARSVFVDVTATTTVPAITMDTVPPQPANPSFEIFLRPAIFVAGQHDAGNTNEYQFLWSSDHIQFSTVVGLDNEKSDLLIPPNVLTDREYYDIQLDIYVKTDTTRAQSIQTFKFTVYTNRPPQLVDVDVPPLLVSTSVSSTLTPMVVGTYLNGIQDENSPLWFRFGFRHGDVEFPISNMADPENNDPWHMLVKPGPSSTGVHAVEFLTPLLPFAETVSETGVKNKATTAQNIKVYVDIRDSLGAFTRIESSNVRVTNGAIGSVPGTPEQKLLAKTSDPLLQPHVTPQNAANAAYLLWHWSHTYYLGSGDNTNSPSVPSPPSAPLTPPGVARIDALLAVLHDRIVTKRPHPSKLGLYQTTLSLLSGIPREVLQFSEERDALRAILVSISDRTDERNKAMIGMGGLVASSTTEGEYRDAWNDYLRLIGQEVVALPTGARNEIDSGCDANNDCEVHTSIVRTTSPALTSLTLKCGGGSGTTQVRPQQRLVDETANTVAVGVMTTEHDEAPYEKFRSIDDSVPEKVIYGSMCSVVILGLNAGATRATEVSVETPPVDAPDEGRSVVQIRFSIPDNENIRNTVECVYRDLVVGQWLTNGVRTQLIDGNVVECTADHLTDFALRIRNPALPPIVVTPQAPTPPGAVPTGAWTDNEEDGGMALLPWIIGMIIVVCLICILVCLCIWFIHCRGRHNWIREQNRRRRAAKLSPKKAKKVSVKPNEHNMALIVHPTANDEYLYVGVPMPGFDDKAVQVNPGEPDIPVISRESRVTKDYATPRKTPKAPQADMGTDTHDMEVYGSSWLWPQELPNQEPRLATVVVKNSPTKADQYPPGENPLTVLNQDRSRLQIIQGSGPVVPYQPPTQEWTTMQPVVTYPAPPSSPPPQYVVPYVPSNPPAPTYWPNSQHNGPTSNSPRSQAYYTSSGPAPPRPVSPPQAGGYHYNTTSPSATNPSGSKLGTNAPLVMRTRSPIDFRSPNTLRPMPGAGPVAGVSHAQQLATNKIALVRPQLGLQLVIEADQSGLEVVVISGINSAGPCGHLPVHPGDQLVTVGSSPVRDVATFVSTIGAMHPGTVTTITTISRRNPSKGPTTHPVVVGAQISVDDFSFLSTVVKGTAGQVYGLSAEGILDRVKAVDTTRDLAVPWPPHQQ